VLAALVQSSTVGAQAIDVAAQASEAMPSVVGIIRFVQTDTRPMQLIGTGFAVGDGRFIVTNAHVLDPPASQKKKPKELARFFALVTGPPSLKADGGRAGRVVPKRLPLTLIDRADAYDLALLKLPENAPTLKPLTVAPTDQLEPPGRAIFSIGFPIGGLLGPFPAVSYGVVSAITPSLSPQRSASQLDPSFIRAIRFALYQLDMTVYPGQSGSPLLHAQTGNVLGVINSTKLKGAKEKAISDPSGISYAITSSELRIFLLRNGIAP